MILNEYTHPQTIIATIFSPVICKDKFPANVEYKQYVVAVTMVKWTANSSRSCRQKVLLIVRAILVIS